MSCRHGNTLARATRDTGEPPEWAAIFVVTPGQPGAEGPAAPWCTVERGTPADEACLRVLETVFALASEPSLAPAAKTSFNGECGTEREFIQIAHDMRVASCAAPDERPDDPVDPVGRLMHAHTTGDVGVVPEMETLSVAAVKKTLMTVRALADIATRLYSGASGHRGATQAFVTSMDGVGSTPYIHREVHASLSFTMSPRRDSKVESPVDLDARYFKPFRTLNGTLAYDKWFLSSVDFDNFMLKSKFFMHSTKEGPDAPGYNRQFALNMGTLRHVSQVRHIEGTERSNHTSRPDALQDATPESFLPSDSAYEQLAETREAFLVGLNCLYVKLVRLLGNEALVNDQIGNLLGNHKIRGTSQVRSALTSTAAARSLHFGDLPGILEEEVHPDDLGDPGLGANVEASHFGGQYHSIHSMQCTSGNLGDSDALVQAVHLGNVVRKQVQSGAAEAGDETPLQDRFYLIFSSDHSPLKHYQGLVDLGLFDEEDDKMLGFSGRFHLGKCSAKDVDRRFRPMLVWACAAIGKTGKALDYILEPSNTVQQDTIMAAIRQALGVGMIVGHRASLAVDPGHDAATASYSMDEVMASATARAKQYPLVHYFMDYMSTATAVVQMYAGPDMDGDLIDRFSGSQNYMQILALGHAVAHAYGYLENYLFETVRWRMLSDFAKCCIANYGWVAYSKWMKHMHVDLHTENKILHYHNAIGHDHKDHHKSDTKHAEKILNLPKLAATKIQRARDQPEESKRATVPVTSDFYKLYHLFARLNLFGPGDPTDTEGTSISPGSPATWVPGQRFNSRVVTQLFDAEEVLKLAGDVKYLKNATYGSPKTRTVASTCPEAPMIESDTQTLAACREVLRTCSDAKIMVGKRDHLGKPMFGAERVKSLIMEHRDSAREKDQPALAAYHLPLRSGSAAPACDLNRPGGTITHVPLTKALNNVGSADNLRDILARTRAIDGPLDATSQMTIGEFPSTPYPLHKVIDCTAPPPPGGRERFPVQLARFGAATELCPDLLAEMVENSAPAAWEDAEPLLPDDLG